MPIARPEMLITEKLLFLNRFRQANLKYKGIMSLVLENELMLMCIFQALYHDVFQNGLTIQHANDAVAVPRIMFRVCYHDDRGSLFIQIGQ